MLPQEQVDLLMDDAERGANAIVSIDLEKQEITGPDGGKINFEVDPFRKHCLLNGLDDIGLTLQTRPIDRHLRDIAARHATLAVGVAQQGSFSGASRRITKLPTRYSTEKPRDARQ